MVAGGSIAILLPIANIAGLPKNGVDNPLNKVFYSKG